MLKINIYIACTLCFIYINLVISFVIFIYLMIS